MYSKSQRLFGFIVSCVVLLFFSEWQLHSFIPFLAMALLTLPLLPCLWSAFGCGLLRDLFAGEEFFGFYSLSTLLAVGLLFQVKRTFFFESRLSLVVLSFFLSLTFSFLEVLIIYEKGGHVDAAFLMLPFKHAFYALICFATPLFFFKPATN